MVGDSIEDGELCEHLTSGTPASSGPSAGLTTNCHGNPRGQKELAHVLPKCLLTRHHVTLCVPTNQAARVELCPLPAKGRTGVGTCGKTLSPQPSTGPGFPHGRHSALGATDVILVPHKLGSHGAASIPGGRSAVPRGGAVGAGSASAVFSFRRDPGPSPVRSPESSKSPQRLPTRPRLLGLWTPQGAHPPSACASW